MKKILILMMLSMPLMAREPSTQPVTPAGKVVNFVKSGGFKAWCENNGHTWAAIDAPGGYACFSKLYAARNNYRLDGSKWVKR